MSALTSRVARGPSITTPALWATVIVELMNLIAIRNKQKTIPLTANNVNNVLRIPAGEGTWGQSGGWLRDNNPANLNTYHDAHGPLYPQYGEVVTFRDWACGDPASCPPTGSGLYVASWPTPYDNAKAMADFLWNYTNAYSLMRDNADPSTFFQNLGAWGDYSGDAPMGGTVTKVPFVAASEAIAKGGGFKDTSGKADVPNPLGPAGPVSPPPAGSKTAKGKKQKAVVGCNAKGNVASESGLPIIHTGAFNFTYCQGKAVVGAFTLAAGGVLMLTGAILVASAGLKAMGAPNPAAGLTGAVTGAATGAVKGPTGALTGAVRGVAKKRKAKGDADDKAAAAAEKADAKLGRQVRRERASVATSRTKHAGSTAPMGPASAKSRKNPNRVLSGTFGDE